MRLNRLLALPIILILVPSLTSCGTATSDTRYTCPPLTDYTPAKQAQVAQEKQEAEAGGKAWPGLINDYSRLRDECRALVK